MDNKNNVYVRSANFKTETRETEDGKKKLVLRGYPILFNVETTIYDWYAGEVKEVVLPTALDGTNLNDVYLLVGHNPDNLLGRANVNMRLEVDETGLFFECELPNTQLARDWYNLVESGIVDGMSFGFICSDQVNWETMKRTITHIDELLEITITPFPAYKEASVVAQDERARAEEKERAKRQEQDDLEKRRADLLKRLED